MKLIRASFGCLLAACLLYCAGCGRDQSELVAAFDYNTTNIPKGKAFQEAFKLFLQNNHFTPSAAPGATGAEAGVHARGATEYWATGSYHGSKPFYLRYYTDPTPNTSICMHGFIFFGVHGSDADMQEMKKSVSEFSKQLQNLADQYNNETPGH